MGAIGRTVGQLTFLADVPTAISGTATLTLDNNGATSPLTVAGHHSLRAGLFFKDNLTIGGGGTLDCYGSLSGAAGRTLTVESGTTLHLRDAAQNIGNSMTVNGHLESGWICVDTLHIGPGGSVTIRDDDGRCRVADTWGNRRARACFRGPAADCGHSRLGLVEAQRGDASVNGGIAVESHDWQS